MSQAAEHHGASLLLLDDDPDYGRVLGRALQRRGFQVCVCATLAEARHQARQEPPEYALLDLALPQGSGLMLIPLLRELDPQTRIVVLTGYASVATAVEAIKLGATHYLAKPVDVDDIVAAFCRQHGDPDTPIQRQPLPVGRVEWEHIQRVLAECGGNISETARQLGMHRRTLQRKLLKRPVS